MTPVVSVFHRFGFGHAARATLRGTHRVSAPTHARINPRVGVSTASPRIALRLVIDTFSLPFALVSVKSRMHSGQLRSIDIPPLRTTCNFTLVPVFPRNLSTFTPSSSRKMEKFHQTFFFQLLIAESQREEGRTSTIRRIYGAGISGRGQYLVNNVNNLAHDTRHSASLRACSRARRRTRQVLLAEHVHRDWAVNTSTKSVLSHRWTVESIFLRSRTAGQNILFEVWCPRPWIEASLKQLVPFFSYRTHRLTKLGF